VIAGLQQQAGVVRKAQGFAAAHGADDLRARADALHHVAQRGAERFRAQGMQHRAIAAGLDRTVG
jgi:hypothetical protein